MLVLESMYTRTFCVHPNQFLDEMLPWGGDALNMGR